MLLLHSLDRDDPRPDLHSLRQHNTSEPNLLIHFFKPAHKLSCSDPQCLLSSRNSIRPRYPRQHLESILQRHHVTIRMTSHLKLSRTNLERPRALWLVVPELEAQPKVTRVLGHTAESVHGALGVGRAVVL
jgi:hypothetical protein